MTPPRIINHNNHWIMPGMASAHSHTFQRVLRGLTQRRQTAAHSFWSWRKLMYDLAERLDPNDVYHIARFAYAELAMSGVTAVGEFHYLHHDKDGKPYPNRTELAQAVIRAAKEVGIRICLIRTAYQRGGYQTPLASAQHRFADATLSPILQDIATLQKQFADDPMVTVAVAAHSIRAVPIATIQTLSNYAKKHHLPFHIHVCEQQRELEESLAEYGTTPIRLLADHGILAPNFVGVHATHLSQVEITALGQGQTAVCLCRTTERDLGDGLPQTSQLVQAGVKLCVGVDSHASSDAFDEIRAVEWDERSRLQARHTVADAPALLYAATRNGYAALGFPAQPTTDRVYLYKDTPELVGSDETNITDIIIFAATPRAVDKVVVAGKTIVENGRHHHYHAYRQQYETTLRKCGLTAQTFIHA